MCVYHIHPTRLMIHCKEEEWFSFTTVNQKHRKSHFFVVVVSFRSRLLLAWFSAARKATKGVQKKKCDPNRMFLQQTLARYFWGFIALEYLITGYYNTNVLIFNNKVNIKKRSHFWFLLSFFFLIAVYINKYNTDQSLVTSINSTLQADVCSRDGACTMDAIAAWIFNRP